MKIPITGKPRVTKVCLFALFFCAFLFLQTACIPPLDLNCDPCLRDGTCGVNTGFVCKDGYCVPESDPNPAQCKTTENTEGGVEQAEVPEEAGTPEESANPEESTNPEDGAPIEQEPIREEGPEPDIKETDKPYIERVNGNGPERPVNAAASPSKIDGLPAAPTKPSPSRIKDALVIEGNLLNQIERWVLRSKDSKNTEQTWENLQIQRDSNMKHTLSLLGRNLVAGSFLLLGFSANTQVVSADVFILQGEKGDPGAQGTQGPKGDGFDQTTLDFVKSLQTTLKPDNAQKSIEITADTVTFKPATTGGKVTLKSGNATLDFAGDTITIKSTTFSLDTTTKIALKSPDVTVDSTTFEVKGTNATSLKLDDTARSVSLRVTQKNATTQATFSLEGGDANTSPAPVTKYPLAIFNRTNVQVQSGAGSTNAAVNGLGNLIIGYNAPNSSPPTGDEKTYREGSHNLVVGDEHTYTKYAGFITGYQNAISGIYSSVSGGQGNISSGSNSSISGGQGNRSGQDIAGTPAPPATHTYVCGGNGKFSNKNHGIHCIHSP